MWVYIKKIIEFIVFSILLEGMLIVAKLSFEGLIDAVSQAMGIALYVAPGVMALFGLRSLLRVQKKRKRSKYERDPIKTPILVIMSIIMVIGVVGAAVAAYLVANHFYSI